MQKRFLGSIIRIGSLGFVLGIMIFFVGCGENKTPRDAEKLRKREQINQLLLELQPLVGAYDGFIQDERTKRNRPIRIVVSLAGNPYPGSNAPDEITAPSLAASVYYYASEIDSQIYVIVPFERSDYDSKNGALNFYSESPKGSLASKVEGDQLSGTWQNDVRGLLGHYVARKTNTH